MSAKLTGWVNELDRGKIMSRKEFSHQFSNCGYGIVAITSVFQTEEMGSIPIIRFLWVDARVVKGGGL